MSFDAPATNHAWSEDEGFGFELWSDRDRTLALAYGAAESASDGTADRITVILDPLGTLVLEYLADVDVGTHPQQVLEDCEVLF